MEDGDVYVTELPEPLSRSPRDRTFFACLDAQLRKDRKFYKEAENIARAGSLEKQMLALINAQETIARQDLLDHETHLDYMQNDKGAHVAGDHLHNPKELSGELPLIREYMERSDAFRMRPAASGAYGDSDEDDETDNAIQDYIDRVASKNLKSGHAEQKERAASGSIHKLWSAMKTASVIPEPVEPY